MSDYWKGTVWFEGSYGAWTEVWHPMASSALGALSVMDSYMPVRKTIMPPSVTITRCEVSDLAVRGDSYLSDLPPIVGTYADTGQMIAPWDAILYALTTAEPTRRGRKFLRGVPANQVTQGKYAPTSDFLTLLAAYKSEVVGNFAIVHSFGGGVFTRSAITDAKATRLVHRPAGRPFGLLVGRRRTR